MIELVTSKEKERKGPAEEVLQYYTEYMKELLEKTVRTVQRALDSLKEKGYLERVGSKQTPNWRILK